MYCDSSHFILVSVPWPLMRSAGHVATAVTEGADRSLSGGTHLGVRNITPVTMWLQGPTRKSDKCPERMLIKIFKK